LAWQTVYWPAINRRRGTVEYDTFVYEVIQRTGLEKRSQAERLIHAVLTTLGERLISRERDRLAAQLPARLKEPLELQPPGMDYPLQRFYALVAQRAEMEEREIVEPVRGVMAVLREGVSRGEIQDVIAALPPEYAELFGKEPVEPLSPALESR
jgi:uncharacterized protein (DUF2267 family)